MTAHGDQSWLVVVPARISSQRLQEKPLQDLGGKPLIIRVYENLSPLVKAGFSVIVATDSERVEQACKKFYPDIEVKMTSPELQSGTDRCWAVAKSYKHPYILNVQGDEPFMPSADLLKLMKKFEANSKAQMGSLVYLSKSQADFANPSIVKAIRAQDGRALYFTRASSPHIRDAAETPFDFWHHLGVYAFRRDALKRFCELKPSPLETRERLEQLRALEDGMSLYLEPSSEKSIGIDTPEDLEAARERF